jgi:alkylhydroperoxidase/carboxymuconolactone decarboxylase family protein YurZ
MDHEAKIVRGKEFFSKVYAQHTNRVLTNLGRGHPDLPIYVIESLYGELLSDFSLLDERSTSLIEMVACIASNAIPQAKGHIYGARNMGETINMIQQCVSLVAYLGKLEGVTVEFGKMEFLGKIGVKIEAS